MRPVPRHVRFGFRTAIALCFSCLLAARTAQADDIEGARRAFTEGVAHFRRGDYEAARALFAEADAAHHAPVIRYNLARAEEKLELFQAAVDHYEAYVAEAGENGEFTDAATIAIAQIKTRSPQVRVHAEATQPDARTTTESAPSNESMPTSPSASVAGSATRGAAGTGPDARDGTSAGTSARAGTVRAKPDAPMATTPAASNTSQRIEPKGSEPDGLIGGAAFFVMPYYLLGVTTTNASNSRPTFAALAGVTAEIGMEITPRFEFMGRGWLATGPEGKPSTGFAIGPAISFKVADALWLGAGFIGGQIETRANDARYGTDLVFGAQGEASLVVLRRWYGEWLVTAAPGLLLTQIEKDNAALFFPVAFGLRAF